MELKLVGLLESKSFQMLLEWVLQDELDGTEGNEKEKWKAVPAVFFAMLEVVPENVVVMPDHINNWTPLVYKDLCIPNHPETIENEQIWGILRNLDKCHEDLVGDRIWHSVIPSQQIPVAGPLQQEEQNP